MNYTRKYFDPSASSADVDADTQSEAADAKSEAAATHGDFAFKPKGGKVDELYVFAPKVVLALNVALATQRPLLVAGEPGCGKSSLARSAALVLGWPYYPSTVTSRTQASDLLWSFDALLRLNHASKQAGTLLPDRGYVEPGPLWWAFDPKTATQRGAKPATDFEVASDPAPGPTEAEGAVALIDEIDKADPDVPNDLLEPFDKKTFLVRETGDRIEAKRKVLMILTTNRERTLPRAFVRRCVTLDLEPPTQEWLANIASQRYGESDDHLSLAGEVMALRDAAKAAGIREPSTAEYLDAVTAFRELGPDRAAADWIEMKRALLWKSDEPFPERKPPGAGP